MPSAPHIGPDGTAEPGQAHALDTLGVESLIALISQTVPAKVSLRKGPC